jgi:hypothetical protein
MNASGIAMSLVLLVVGTARAATGDLDPGFGDYGRVRLELPGGEYARREPLARQPDGSIVLARTDTHGGINVLHFNPDGSVDPGFGANGVAHFTYVDGGASSARSIAVGPGGKVRWASVTWRWRASTATARSTRASA